MLTKKEIDIYKNIEDKLDIICEQYENCKFKKYRKYIYIGWKIINDNIYFHYLFQPPFFQEPKISITEILNFSNNITFEEIEFYKKTKHNLDILCEAYTKTDLIEIIKYKGWYIDEENICFIDKPFAKQPKVSFDEFFRFCKAFNNKKEKKINSI